VDARALELGERDDGRRVGRREEVVESGGHGVAAAVGEAEPLEVVLREAGLADALHRELHRAAAAAALPAEGEVLVALAEVDRRREPGVVRPRPLARLEPARLQVAVVALHGAAPPEGPGDAPARLARLG